MSKKIVFHGDMGGDDLWAAILLAYMVQHKDYELLGIGACFGNTTAEQATWNIINVLPHIGLEDVPVYKGAEGPLSGVEPLLDGAFGDTGLSNADLEKHRKRPEFINVQEWFEQTLLTSKDPIHLICTGPLTDLAAVLQKYPELENMGHEVSWMGGSILPSGGRHKPVKLDNGRYKRGNITDHSEFNAINDPLAAQVVADSKMKFTVLPMGATQHLAVDYKKVTHFLRELSCRGEIATQFLSMLDNSYVLDSGKFSADGPFQHDAQLFLQILEKMLFPDVRRVKNLTFANRDELAKNFNAVTDNFDFSKLGTHGKMTCDLGWDSKNNFVIPGLYTFTDPRKVTDKMIAQMDAQCKKRWESITEKAKLVLR